MYETPRRLPFSEISGNQDGKEPLTPPQKGKEAAVAAVPPSIIRCSPPPSLHEDASSCVTKALPSNHDGENGKVGRVIAKILGGRRGSFLGLGLP